MNPLDIHDEWLSLIEVSGPFLATPVLKRVFSTGLPAVEPRIRQYLRQAYDEWCEARDNDDPRFTELHRAWIHEVLARGLEYDESDSGEFLLRGERIPLELRVTLPEHGVTLEPDFALVLGGKSQLLVKIYSAGTDLQAALKLDGWSASPAERMERLCRASGCRLGLVTDGERWMLIDAPVGAVSTFASWYARLWGQERLTLQAFLTLLGIRRFFGPDDESLPSMLDESLQHQEEVTDALGEQVRRAVEVLIQALGKEDRERSGTLLQGVEPTELYEAGLTIMMRLVFLLSAEERGLLLMGEEAYESNYSISTLRMQLRQETEDVLERRNDAWSRLLATFRAVYGGIEHEMLRLPALGGSLFDPDRFPFLEGRSKGSDWRIDSARPLPIDNRTVLLLLEAIQQYEGRTLSYRALDVEQIGYVYEGLLERTVGRTERVTVELAGGKGAKKTLYSLEELEALYQRGGEVLAEALSGAGAIKRGGAAIHKDLERSVDAVQANRLLTACAGDEGLRDRALPFLNLLRTDPWGYPLIYPEGAFIVTTGSDRRDTGTHYTPKSLTTRIVETTLEPIAYVGPAEGLPREQWSLKSAAELLDLKICDPAMGSGAFLVQVCRWLAERIVDAWAVEEKAGRLISSEGVAIDDLDGLEALPVNPEDRLVIARRLAAERCLYGVDLNPLAVELAKLSIWLVTLAKGRPFGFLDHNLRCGDSLLGLHRLDQLTELSMTPTGKGQQRLFGQNIERAVREAIELRSRLREMPIRDIRDVEAMAYLEADARRKLEVSECIANMFIGEIFASGGNGAGLQSALASLTIQAGQAIDGDRDVLASMRWRSATMLSTDLPTDKLTRRPFHWPLEFPEVFERGRGGFDGIVGNPPFLGGRRMRAALGQAYVEYLTNILTMNGSANANLCAFFMFRVSRILKQKGAWGLIATSAVREGDSRKTGLNQVINLGCQIYEAVPLLEWPGDAAVTISLIWVFNGKWNGEVWLKSECVQSISTSLTADAPVSSEPFALANNKGMAFQGSNILGAGFVLEPFEANELFESSSKYQEVVKRFLRGEDFVESPTQEARKFIIDFGDMPLSRKVDSAAFVGKVAEDYEQCLSRIVERVKPERERQKRRPYRERWWQYAERCASLYAAISGLSRVIFQPSPSKHLAFCFVDSKHVFSGPHTVIASNSYRELGILISSIHAEWCWVYCSTMPSGSRRYNPSDYLRFPKPSGESGIENAAAAFDSKRRAIMLKNSYGIGALMNRFHDGANFDSDILDLRGALKDLDTQVLRSYNWSDLSVEYEFREIGKGQRLGFKAELAKEVLSRLLELNHRQYEEEIAQGLQGSKTVISATRKPRAEKIKSTPAHQPSFDFDAAPANGGPYLKTAEPQVPYRIDPAHAIVEHLKAHTGWHSKSDILSATNVTGSQWNTAINDLLSSGRIKRQGEKRGARYCFVVDFTAHGDQE